MSEVGRREVLFLYDAVYSNPNGDPNDENKPRLDEETNRIFVTDVRLKRTIRDYLKDVMGKEVYIYEEMDEETGKRVSKNKRLKRDFNNDPYEAVKRCIDLKLFGATFALKKEEKSSSKKKKVEEAEQEEKEVDNNLSIIGPVQFRFGRSLHAVKLQYVKGTSVMPSDDTKRGGTFTDKWIVPYALIAFYGIVNGIVADKEKLNLTLGDLDAMYTAMWYGTRDLFTSSKAQTPLLLTEVVYKQDNYHIGDLERTLSISTDMNEQNIRDTKDYILDVTQFVEILKEHADKISLIRARQNPILRVAYNGEEKPMEEILKQQAFEVQDFSFEG